MADTGRDTKGLAGPLGTAFAAARRDKGWTQEELAEACGLTAGYIARLERGQRLPSPLILDQLARTLGLEVGDIWPRATATVGKRSPREPSKRDARRDAAIARLLKVLEVLSASDVRQIASVVQRLVKARHQ